MISSNGNMIVTDVQDILIELKRQLNVNGIKRFEKFIDTKNNVQTNCPFHKDGQERKPSFGVSKIDGACHCFGCGWAGTLDEMISNCFGYDDFGVYGSKWLARNFLSVEVANRQELDLNFSRNKNVVKQDYVEDALLDSYRYTHPYMYKRKLTDEIIELFDIGYDKTDGCITFPVRDITGGTLFVAKRSVNTKFFHYPDGVEKPVYGLYELREVSKISFNEKTVDGCNVRLTFEDYPNEVIICESMLDCLYFWTIGKYAVALNGLGNDLQFKQLNAMPCRKFILCTDSDEAGMKARKRIRANLKNKIVTEYILPEGRKDANDCTIDELKSLQEVF